MTSEAEVRSRPIQRQAGFNIAQTADGTGNNGISTNRIRTTTGDTIVRYSFDGDVEMGDDKRGVQPLPIPRAFDGAGKLNDDTNAASATGSSRENNDLPTPPDDVVLSTKADQQHKDHVEADVKVAGLRSTLISPRITTISSSHVSSGPASLSSAQWSPPSRKSDPHLYSISGQPYSNASVKPYLSTSFQTSAERGAGAGSATKSSSRQSLSREQRPHNVDEMHNDDDDVFGNTTQGLGLHNTGEPSTPHLRRSNDVDREEGDAAGVFSFSSPYFGPRSLETSDVPPLSPPPHNKDARSHAHAQRMMSPSWTAASLGKLSLGGPSETATPPPGSSAAAARRPPFGVSPQAAHSETSSGAQALYSQSLPSGVHSGLTAHSDQAAWHSSSNRRPQPGPSMLHPHASYYRPRAGERARSSSRHRPERTARTLANVDDDETDEDELMAMQEDDDDDATEDEAEPQIRVRNGQRHSGRYDELAYAAPHRHPSGQPTTMSASYDRAQSGLSRQYSSDRYAHLSMSRHHPYAISPSGASPSNGGVLASYSPGNVRGPLGRRRSSFGSGSVLSGSPSNGMIHALSHSPRYIQSIPRAPPAGSYSDQHAQQHPGSLPKHASFTSTAHAYGVSPEGAALLHAQRQNAAGQQQRYDDGDDEDDDDDGRLSHHQRSTVRSSKPTARSTSASRAAAAAAASGDVESPEMVEVNAIRERLGGAANCSAFISKLWYLMCRPELYSRYIHWSESGDSVILSNDPQINNEFASEVLPKLFKHGNNASFVRQLNLYGFQRVPSSRLLDAAEIKAARRYASGASISTALQLYGPHSSFAHPRFKKDQESLLPSMKPRSSKKTKKTGGSGAADTSRESGKGGESDGDEDLA